MNRAGLPREWISLRIAHAGCMLPSHHASNNQLFSVGMGCRHGLCWRRLATPPSCRRGRRMPRVKLASLERAARQVPADHVLSPYVEYWRLMLTSRDDDARIADFLSRYPGSRMAEGLRADWLKSLGVHVKPGRCIWRSIRVSSNPMPRISAMPTAPNGRWAIAATSARRCPCGLPGATCRRPARRCSRS